MFAKGYIAKQSSHSRGSAIDLTLLDMKTGKEVDMGSPFDLFSEVSHPDYRGVTQEQYENRMLLQHVMVRNGFLPLDCEWWHFVLKDEPYPDTYFRAFLLSSVPFEMVILTSFLEFYNIFATEQFSQAPEFYAFSA